MATSEWNTANLHDWLARMRAGDTRARDDLIRHAASRLEDFARGMLRKNPRVRRWAETGDVLQEATLRLLRALESVTPPSLRDFFSLAATQIRRELIDLARHYYGKQGLGANHASGVLEPNREDAEGFQPVAETEQPEELVAWSDFHAKVEALPELDREIMNLHYYQGMQLIDVAKMLGISERSAQVYWKRAKLKLYELLQGTWPEL